MKTDPDHVKAIESLGFILLEQGDADLAQAQLEKTRVIAPHDLDVNCDLGRTYARSKQTDKAVEDFIACCT